MPLYRFSCSECEKEFELFMTMRKRYEEKSPTPFVCTHCGSEKTIPLISKTSFSLKGKGWYKDGYS